MEGFGMDKRVKGFVQRYEDGIMKVFCDNNEWYDFGPEAVQAAVAVAGASKLPDTGERVCVALVEEQPPELVLLQLAAPTAEELARSLYRYDHIEMERVATADQVGEEEIRRFWERGYLVIDQLLSGEETTLAAEAVNDIIHGRIVGPRLQFMKKTSELRTDEDREMSMRKLHKFVDFSPALHHAGYHPDALRVLEAIFGEAPRLLEDQAILKPPSVDAGGEKPWHQDMAYGNISQTKMVCGVWIALDEATLENGCMHVIPGTHRDGPIPHYAIRDWQLCDAHVDVASDVAVPLRPGGALFFAGLLHHGTPPNFSTSKRRALQFHYSPESSRKMTPQEFRQAFMTDTPAAEC